MWKYQYSKYYRGVSSDEVWQLWAEVTQWHTWFKVLMPRIVANAFVLHNPFILQFKGEDPVFYTILEIVENRSFLLKKTFLGAVLLDQRSIEVTQEGVRLHRQLTLTGPMTFFWKHRIMKTVFYKSSIEFEYLVTEARLKHYNELSNIKDALEVKSCLL